MARSTVVEFQPYNIFEWLLRGNGFGAVMQLTSSVEARLLDLSVWLDEPQLSWGSHSLFYYGYRIALSQARRRRCWQQRESLDGVRASGELFPAAMGWKTEDKIHSAVYAASRGSKAPGICGVWHYVQLPIHRRARLFELKGLLRASAFFDVRRL